MLLLCWTPFKLQLTEGSLQVTNTDTLLTLSACRFTAKLWSTVKGRSMFVIIHKIICLSIIGIMLHDLEMQALGSQGKHKEAVWGFPSLPKTSAYQGLRLKDEDRLYQGHSHHPIPLPTSPKEPHRKKIYPLQKHCSIPDHLQVQTPMPTVCHGKINFIRSESGMMPYTLRKVVRKRLASRCLCGDPKCYLRG